MPRNPLGFGGDLDWGLPFQYCYDMNDVDGEEISLILLSLNIIIACLISKVILIYLRKEKKSVGSKIISVILMGSSVLYFFNDKVPHGLPRHSWHPIYIEAKVKVYSDHLVSNYKGNKNCLFLSDEVFTIDPNKLLKDKLTDFGFSVKSVEIKDYNFISHEQLKEIIKSNPDCGLIITTRDVQIRESLKDLLNSSSPDFSPNLTKLPMISTFGPYLFSKNALEDKILFSLCVRKYKNADLSGLDMDSSPEEIFHRIFDIITLENYLEKAEIYPDLSKKYDPYFDY